MNENVINDRAERGGLEEFSTFQNKALLYCTTTSMFLVLLSDAYAGLRIYLNISRYSKWENDIAE